MTEHVWEDVPLLDGEDDVQALTEPVAVSAQAQAVKAAASSSAKPSVAKPPKSTAEPVKKPAPKRLYVCSLLLCVSH